MASTPDPRLEPLPVVVGTSNNGVLPHDLFYEILLRLPAKQLCRFRAVCTSWRFLLCHPDFITAHQRHNPYKGLAVGICGIGSFQVTLMDMDSGCAIKRVSVESTSHHHRLPHEIPAVNLNRAMRVVGSDKRVSLMDLDTGALSLLPDHAMPRGYINISYTLGHAASTGEYKLLAIATFETDPLELQQQQEQVCKILTVGGGRNWDGGPHWRGTGSPLCRVVLPSYNRETTVIEGVAYFLLSGLCYEFNHGMEIYHDWITSFNLDSEAWRPAPIQGPTGCRGFGLAELDGNLVAFHDDRRTCVKLWYLVDPDHAIWSMLHQISMMYHTLPLPSPQSRARYHEYFEKPLAILGDGRIVMWMRVHEDTVLRIYDPRTGAFTDGTRVANCHNMGVHTSSILYTGRGEVVK